MPTKEQEAIEIAHSHYRVEEGMVEIFRLRSEPEIESRPDEPIKLLEVNESTVPSGIMPLYFGPSPKSGREHGLMILEVTPEEFDQIQRQELRLPNDWSIAEPIAAPDAVTAP